MKKKMKMIHGPHTHYFGTIPVAFYYAMLMLRGKDEEFSRNQQDQGHDCCGIMYGYKKG